MPDYIGTSNDEEMITVRKRGDSFPRLAIEADGNIKFGRGDAAASVSPYPGVIIPPAVSFVGHTTETAWFGNNYAVGVRFDLQRGAVINNVVIPCTIASGNIEVSIHKIMYNGTTVGTFSSVRVATTGIIACPSPSSNVIRPTFSTDVELSMGQYVVMLWCNNTTAAFAHTLNNTLIRVGLAITMQTDNATGSRETDNLVYSGRSVAILLEEKSANQKKIVLLGDSITANQTWFGGAMVLANRGYTVVNKGNPGEPTAQMAARVAADVVAQTPSYCFVLGGTNDIGSSIAPSTIISNLASIYSQCKAAGIKVMAATIPPRENTAIGDPLSASNAANLAIVNSYIRSLNDSNITIVDVNSSLRLGNVDSVMNTSYFTDHVHPNALGQLKMAELVKNYI